MHARIAKLRARLEAKALRACEHCGGGVGGRGRFCSACRDTASPWRVSSAMLERACIELGIEGSVVVRRAPLEVSWGRYEDRRTKQKALAVSGRKVFIEGVNRRRHVHVIVVHPRLTPSLASRVLWHELSHARDMEMIPNMQRKSERELHERTSRLRAGGLDEWDAYAGTSFEVRAAAAFELHTLIGPLTLPNRRATMKRDESDQLIVEVANGRIEYSEAFEDTLENMLRRGFHGLQVQCRLDKKLGARSPFLRARRKELARRRKGAGKRQQMTRVPRPRGRAVNQSQTNSADLHAYEERLRRWQEQHRCDDRRAAGRSESWTVCRDAQASLERAIPIDDAWVPTTYLLAEFER